MGSVCCTAGRNGDMAETSHSWSMEQTGHAICGLSQSALSPPPFSLRWDMKTHFLEPATGHSYIPTQGTPLSSSRSFRSSSNTMNNSNSKNFDGLTFHRQCETTTDGLLALFNSPSESFRYCQHSVDQIPGSLEVSSDPFYRSSAAGLCQEESSGSLSKSSSVSRSVCKLDVSTSHNRALSWQALNPSGRDDKGVPVSRLGSSSYEPKLISSLDQLPHSTMEQLVGKWKMRGYSEFMESSHSHSLSASRTIGLTTRSYAGLEIGKPGNISIGSSKAMLCQGLHVAEAEGDAQTCGLCFKAISERSPWCFSKVLGSRKELPVVAVLDCGHVYHAECLDQATPAMQAHDPPCPACDALNKSQLKGKTLCSSLSKMKVSRVRISNEDPVEVEWSKRFPSPCASSGEWSSQKVGLELPPQSADRNFSAKSLVLRKQCSIRGKASRDSFGSSFATKRPGYPSRVSPETTQMENGLLEVKHL